MFSKLIKNKNIKETIAALDLGSNRIICLIANINPIGEIEVIGIGHQISQGIHAGTISDIKLAEEAIVSALDSAERMAGINVDKVIISLSGASTMSHEVSTNMKLPGNEITKREIGMMIRQALERFDQNKYEIIHYFPLGYSVDDIPFVRNPEGMLANNFSSRLHVVTVSSTAVNNITRCLARCHLDIGGCIIASYASAEACLTKDEKELGVTLIDMGASTTSFSIFFEGKLIYTGFIPLGGMNITSDIARGISVSRAGAERIKILYGSTQPTYADNHKMIDIKKVGELTYSDEASSVSNATLNNIIAPRAEEILELVKQKLSSCINDHSLLKRMVLTGGASQLSGTKELASAIFQTKPRLARPKIFYGIEDDNRLISFTAAIGTLEYAAKKLKKSRADNTRFNSKNNLVGNMLEWVKTNI